MTDASRMCFLQQHVCEICGKSYAQKKVLIRHLTLHNNEKLDCSICNKSFGSKFHLQKHDKRHNNRELLFECGQCGNNFWSKSSLTKHTQTKHNNFVFGCLYWSERPGIINKILRLKQEGEHLHAVINRIERNLTMTLNKSTRYWQVLRDYENKLYNGLK